MLLISRRWSRVSSLSWLRTSICLAVVGLGTSHVGGTVEPAATPSTHDAAIDGTQIITTVLAQYGTTGGVAVHTSGDVYFTYRAYNQVMKVTAATGMVTHVAGINRGVPRFGGDGGPATRADLWFPTGLAVDTAGNVYIADSVNQRIRKVTAATGVINTVAGGGSAGLGDGGPATSAQVAAYDVAVDAAGSLYIAGANRIRKVTASTGVITTVAGSGSSLFGGFSGDGGQATSAQLSFPRGIAVDGEGHPCTSGTTSTTASGR